MDGKINQTYYNFLLSLYQNDEIERLNGELWYCEERDIYTKLLFQELCQCNDKQKIRKYVDCLIFERKEAGLKLIVQHFETPEITKILLKDEELLINNIREIVLNHKIDKLEIINKANSEMLRIFIEDILALGELKSQIQQILNAVNKEKLREFIQESYSGYLVKTLFVVMDDIDFLEECMMDEDLGISYFAKIEILRTFGERAKHIYRRIIERATEFHEEFVLNCLKELGDVDLAIGYFSENKGKFFEEKILNEIIEFKDVEKIKRFVESEELNLSLSDKVKLILKIGQKDYAEECIRNEALNLDEPSIAILKLCYEIGIEEYISKIKENKAMLKTPKNSTKGIEIESYGKMRYQREAITNIDRAVKNAQGERKWGCCKDGGGIEFASYVMEDDEQATNSIYYTCHILKEQKHIATEEDGGHVHVGTNILTNVQSYKNLLEMWFNLEKAMFLVSNQEYELPRIFAIDEDEYANPKSNILNYLIQSGEIQFREDATIEEFCSGLKKYLNKNSSINICNVGKGDESTIEFRTPNGIIDPKIWIENVNFFTSLVQSAEDLYQIQTKPAEERTEEENKKLQLFKKIKSKEVTEKDKFESLLNIMLDGEEERNIYRKRYIINNECLKHEMNREIKEILEAKTANYFVGFNSKEIGEYSFAKTNSILEECARDRLYRDKTKGKDKGTGFLYQ